MEEAFPEVDRFDARTWRRLLAGRSVTLVHESEGVLDANAILLFRKGSSVARLYSISVAPAARCNSPQISDRAPTAPATITA